MFKGGSFIGVAFSMAMAGASCGGQPIEAENEVSDPVEGALHGSQRWTHESRCKPSGGYHPNFLYPTIRLGFDEEATRFFGTRRAVNGYRYNVPDGNWRVHKVLICSVANKCRQFTYGGNGADANIFSPAMKWVNAHSDDVQVILYNKKGEGCFLNAPFRI